MGRRDPKDLRIEALEAQVAKLTELLAKAMARIADLEAQLNKNSTNSSKPPSSDPPGLTRSETALSGRKPGGQPGHAKHERCFLPPDRVVHARPRRCWRCGKALDGDDPAPERHQVVEFPRVKPDVTDYLIHSLGCDCGAVTRAELPAGVPRRGYGPRVVAAVSLLTGKYRQSKRMTRELLADLFGIDISLGTVSNLEQEMSEALAPPVAEACEHVRTQPVANLDETGWYEGREDGRAGRAWLWTAVTSLVTVFQIARSRGEEIAKQLLGADFAGFLGSDRWSGYAWLRAKRRQLCWAHLIRDFQGFVDREDAGSQYGVALLDLADKMFQWWPRVRDGTLSRGTFRRYMAPVRREVVSLLRKAVACPAPKSAGMAKQILKFEAALFTFVNHEGIEPTNNSAERAVRHGVMYRKTSFGTQSAAGSRFVERILTVVATLRQQRRNVVDFLAAAYSAKLNHSQSPSLLPQ